MNKISVWLTPPVFEDEEQNRVAQLLNIFLWTTLIAVGLATIVFWGFGSLAQDLWVLFGVTLMTLAGIGLMRRNHLTLAALLVLLVLAAFLTYLPFQGDGIHDTALVVYPALIIAASLLLKPRLFTCYVALLMLLVGLITFGEIVAGLIVTYYDKWAGLRDAIILIIVLAITAISVRTLTDILVTSLARARRSERALAETNAQLQAEIEQRRQAERTLRQAETLLWRRNQELTLLNQVGQELNVALDTVQVNERLLQAVVETIGAEGAAIWLRGSDTSGPDENSDPNPSPAAAHKWEPGEEITGLICRAVFRSDRDRPLINLRLQPGQGLAGWAAQAGESVMVDNAAEDPRFFAGVDALSGFQTRSLLTVPLKVHGYVLGVLQVANKLVGNFNSDDLIFAETLAASAAIALQNAQLVEVLRRRTHQLERQNEELDAYAHTVAHDLKTPIARLVGFAEALADLYTKLSPAERRQYLRVIAQSGRSVLTIIDELLLLAGVRRAQKVDIGPLEMIQVVQAAQNRLADAIKETQAELITPLSWPPAVGYGPWLEEVWVNYISNALKYGGQPPQVELGADTLRSGQVRFWVRDNGPGLKPEEQARLFTPFTRLDETQARGHGLGLSIVRRIVERLEGQVGVESQGIPGQGCTFWFTLNPPTAVVPKQ
jgi:signal transduction histidine kinase